ncbi:MAG: CinA family nicotinamide mononucleotide deamidase-related protein [Acidimicrobiia bacterium]
MIVEIVAVGTELLIGQIINSNAAAIGSRLAEEGFDVHYQTTVGDNIGRLGSAIEDAAQRADAVILTGGIGPTQDDLTREAICAVTGREMLRDEVHAQGIHDRLSRAGRSVTANTLRMADYPEGAEPLPNRAGVALGVAVEHEQTWIFAIPGIPTEMIVMLDEQVVPRLREISGEQAVLKSRVLHTWGFGEAQVADLLDDLFESENPSIAFLVHASEIRVRITAKAGSVAAADDMISVVEAQVRDRLGDAVFGVDEDTVEGLIVGLLDDRSWKISTVEASTLGMVAGRIAGPRSGRSVFAGGRILSGSDQANDVERRALQLLSQTDEGDVLVSISEISHVDADSAGGLSPRKVGIGVRTPEKTMALTVGLLGDDERARQFAVVGALHAVRLAVGGDWWQDDE